MKVNVKGIKLTESQRLIYNAANDKEHKYVMANISRQQGKTTVVTLLCIQWLSQKNQEIIYFTPTYSLAKRIYGKIAKMLPQNFVAKANASDLVIESVTGSQLRFFSGEAAQSARGSNCTKLVIDEAAYIKEEIDGQNFYYNIVLPLTKVHCDKIVMISTPKSTFGFYYELCMQALSGERKDMVYIKRTIYDDALIDKNEIEELKKNYPPMAWKAEFECLFITDALSVFPDYEKCFDIDECKKTKCWIGIDPSSVGEDNTIVSIVNDRNEVKQYKIEGSLDEKYSKIAHLINVYAPIATYMESNSIGEVMANEVKKKLTRKSNFYTFATTNETKKDYISLIAVNIANGTIHFERDNKLLFSELGTFTYKLTKSGNITYAAQEPFHDDTVTSLGIALQCKEDFKYQGINKNKFILTNAKRFI
ncbi:MAG: terminase family protein [Methanobrevibacter sp.]|nr:terminase family protein [Methanobrevibacter sp.]